MDLAPLSLPRQQAVADDADGESVEAMLLRMLEHDADGESIEHEENIIGFPSLSTMSQVLNRNEHAPPVISGSHLQNLRPPNYVWDPDASSSLSSENTFVPSTEVSPRGSHQLLSQPPPSGKSVFHSPLSSINTNAGNRRIPNGGSLGGSISSNNNEDSLVIKIVVSVSVPSPPTVASVEEFPNVGRITKLTKKYFCFM